MKSWFLPLGAGADRALPGLLSAFGCGAARQAPSVSMLRIPASRPEELADRLLADLNFCHRLLAPREEFAFFRTEWTADLWLPRLPDRDQLVENQQSRLLLQALRGEGVPFSFRTDREAAEWSLSALLQPLLSPETVSQEVPEKTAAPEASGADAESLAPFRAFLSQVRAALDAGEEVRILLMCDLCEGYAAGLALGLMRFLRAYFRQDSLFLGLVGQVRAFGASALEDLAAARETLAVLSDRNLVRASEERDTLGADACWLLGLPSALMTGEESCLLLDWAAARVLGEVWTASDRPSPGLHTRELPGTLTLKALDQEAKPAAAFLRGSFWCLSDLFPALRSWMEHPALLRGLAPATRGGLFRRLFRDQDLEKSGQDLSSLERTFRALTLQFLSLLQSVPSLLREEAPVSALWQEAVQACGRTVTLASEYDVRRQEAEESGVDQVMPVHRVSLSDTEEEQLLHQLDRMAEELSGLRSERSGIFHRAGGYLSRLSLEDCLAKCRVARVSAAEKLSLLPSDTPEERFELARQARRVRLLEAAILRCQQDLKESQNFETLRFPGTLRPSALFAGEILSPEAAAQALTLLSSEGEAAEAAAKALRESLESLLVGQTLNDGKTLLKNLIATCRQPEPESPLRGLMAGIFSVCGVEVSGLRFHSAGQLPAVPLLPDLTEPGRFFSLASAPGRMLASVPEENLYRKRGLLALMLLRQYRRRNLGEAALEILPLREEDSVLTRVWLSSRGISQAFLCTLRSGEGEEARNLPLALLLPEVGLEPARPQPSRMDLVPSFCFWADRDTGLFRDPCAYFSEADRRILTEQLTRLRACLKSPRSRVFVDFLSDWHQDIMRSPRQGEDPEALKKRLRVACGLTSLPSWQKELQRVSAFYEGTLTDDPLCAALCGQESFEPASCEIREDILYAFRGTPLAREHARLLLEGTHAPEEDLCLASLDTECGILLHSSDDYHEALAASLRALMDRYPQADPDARETAESLLQEALAPISDQVTDLTWPWDTYSASVLTILTECLGPELAASALHAFSDKLALFPARGGEILGDVLLSGLCVLGNEPEPSSGEEASSAPAEASPAPETGAEPPQEASVRTDAVLPPLSRDFAAALCRLPRGQSLLTPGFLAFDREGGGVRVTLTLEGAFTLRLIRRYAPEEVLSFYAHDLPTLALWPSLPFPSGAWQAYHSYAHGPEDFRFTALSREEEIPLTGSAPRYAACQREYPLCYLISWQGEDIGAVPNLLPAPEIPEGGDQIACLDFGAAATSVIFSDGRTRWPMQGPVTVRTLLRSPAVTEELLWREFLPAVPVSALLPGALRIFRNDLTGDDLPLRDGAIFMSSSLRDVLEVSSEALYTDLKWNGEKGRAARLYLHQVMLMAALQARCTGAATLRWRTTLPEEMPPEGRQRLADLFRSLAGTVAEESGIPLPAKEPPAAFSSESGALGAYFRFCSPDQTRGGFMALDLGADTADLSLYLRGREEAVRSLQLPLGLHNMLLPALLSRPGILEEDFGYLQDPLFRRDLSDLQALLERARRDPAALRQARYALDALVADHMPLLLSALAERRAAGQPGRTGALILLHFSFLMMSAGLLLLQIAGDSLQNDGLPETMTLFLAGRGSQLMEALSPQTRASLWKLLTMFRNPRVSSMNLLFSAEKKLEIPVGLSVLDRLTAVPPRPVTVPAAIAVRPEELMPEFLLRFRREFPEEAQLLFPGLYANDYYSPFTPYGQQLLMQALQAAFGGREAGRPFDGLSAFLSHLMEMIQEVRPA